MMDYGVFVCSSCAGIHREMTHKVKGIAMSNFTDKEVQSIKENGNKVSISKCIVIIKIMAFVSNYCINIYQLM